MDVYFSTPKLNAAWIGDRGGSGGIVFTSSLLWERAVSNLAIAISGSHSFSCSSIPPASISLNSFHNAVHFDLHLGCAES
jgi:hypothetical protein